MEDVKQGTSSSNFVLWKAYLRRKALQEFAHREKQDYYLARIALEIRRTVAKHPRRLKLKDFLLTFDSPEQAPARNKPKRLTKKQKEVKLAKSKAFWFGITAVPRKPPPQPKRD